MVITEESQTSLFRWDVEDNSFVDKGTLPITLGYERGMGWAVSPVLEGGKTRIVFGNTGIIKMVYDALDDIEFTFSDYIIIMNGEIHSDQHYMKFSYSGETLFIGNDGGIYKADMSDPLGSWENLNNGLGVSTPFRVSTSQNGVREVLASFQDMGTIRIENISGNWFPTKVGGADGTDDYINPVNSLEMASTNQISSSVEITTDNWLSSNGVSLTNSPHTRRIGANSKDHQLLYGCTRDGLKKYEIGSSGSFILNQTLPIESSINVGAGYNYPQYIFDLTASENPQYSDYIYVFWRGGVDNLNTSLAPDIVLPRIYRTTVGGGTDPSSWEQVYQYSSNEYGAVTLKFDDPNVFWVTHGGKVDKVDLSSGGEPMNYSDGLPDFTYSAIKKIVYVRGSNDALFAGTKEGLYYRDNDNYPDGWVRVCSMPNTPIYDLEIDYCRRKLIVATYGRGIWEADLGLIGLQPFVISENMTISGDYYLGTDIIIEPGANLTVTGTLYMPEGSKILVSPRGQLTVNGGKITNECGHFWSGIEVWGNNALSQSSTNQGRVVLTNGAVIENAEVAVSLWKSDDWSTTGGIIFSTNATFKNNKKDVEFVRYQNFHPSTGEPFHNLSYFTNTSFIWDDDFRAEVPLTHVTMYKVDGIRFSGCYFADNRTIPESQYALYHHLNNTGIRSIDANYIIQGHCIPLDYDGCDVDILGSDWAPTKFENLDFGIYASNSTTDYSISVDRSVFRNNLYGAELIDINSPVVTRSVFDYTNVNNNFESYTEYGIHAVRSNEIRFEENEFENISSSGTTTGIVCSDLGESNEQIYKNWFTNLSYGIATQGKNRSEFGDKGLLFFCDSNVNNNYDHLILNTLWGDPGTNFGVKKFNGSTANPAGNDFTQLSANAVEDYDNVLTPLVGYYYYNAVPTEQPIDVSSSFFSVPTSSQNMCLTQFNDYPIGVMDPGIKERLITDFGVFSEDLVQKQQTFLI